MAPVRAALDGSSRHPVSRLIGHAATLSIPNCGVNDALLLDQGCQLKRESGMNNDAISFCSRARGVGCVSPMAQDFIPVRGREGGRTLGVSLLPSATRVRVGGTRRTGMQRFQQRAPRQGKATTRLDARIPERVDGGQHAKPERPAQAAPARQAP